MTETVLRKSNKTEKYDKRTLYYTKIIWVGVCGGRNGATKTFFNFHFDYFSATDYAKLHFGSVGRAKSFSPAGMEIGQCTLIQ